jgi:predicted ATPase
MQQNGQLVFLPEYLRLEAEMLAASGDTGAEQVYLQAIELARTQSALSWELRATLGLARLHRGRDPQRARGVLMGVYGRFIEGYETKDLLSAKSLIDELSSHTRTIN